MRKILLLILLLPLSLHAGSEKLTFIYYYSWYGSIDYDGRWAHWEENNHQPPHDISSSYYPKLGSYSSQNPKIVEQHMRWIQRMGIQVLIYSWWGRDDPTHYNADVVFDAAAKYGLKIAFLIEPYLTRTPRRICDDIEHLQNRFGKHKAFFRMKWHDQQLLPAGCQRYKQPSRLRAMFFLYDPDYADANLRNTIRNIHETDQNPIVLLQSTDASLMERTGADGIFAYEAYQPLEKLYPGIANEVRKRRGIFIPSVSPGFNINRTFGEKLSMQRLRRNGKNYDDWWESVLASDTNYVAVISFNEWHEGTQVEPAVAMAMPINGYLSYEGAYGLKGADAEKSYLRRTARWIQLFLASVVSK